MLCHCTTDPVSVKSDINRDPLIDLFASRFVQTISTLPIASDAKKIVDYYHILKLTRNARDCNEIPGNICIEMQHNHFFCAFNSHQNDFYIESTPCKTSLLLQYALEVNQRRVQFSGLGVSQDRNGKAAITSTICHVIEGVDQKDGCC